MTTPAVTATAATPCAEKIISCSFIGATVRLALLAHFEETRVHVLGSFGRDLTGANPALVYSLRLPTVWIALWHPPTLVQVHLVVRDSQFVGGLLAFHPGRSMRGAETSLFVGFPTRGAPDFPTGCLRLDSEPLRIDTFT